MQMIERKIKKRKRVSEGDVKESGRRKEKKKWEFQERRVRGVSEVSVETCADFDTIKLMRYTRRNTRISIRMVLNLHLDEKKHGQWIKRICVIRNSFPISEERSISERIGISIVLLAVLDENLLEVSAHMFLGIKMEMVPFVQFGSRWTTLARTVGSSS